MSAPKDNFDKEARKSVWPLLGIALVVLFAVGLIVFWLFEEAVEAPAPGESGEVEQDVAPPGQPGVGSVPAPEGVVPQEVEPEVLNPSNEEY
ncbi:hypothetical protein OEW28_09435 [Defluviimonas sp. WL0002]|uniref:Uncharacterized protein n=1 Tax=Albidovulum marisflavi TaxID=2984159 RepID=A0ABT2ZCK0_9RHOB|nr:hypothetical protein [Defluviimonas sp. WL0002]MCV2868849.1 hypothetical protein [Defluviimonas sp. WL0002]